MAPSPPVLGLLRENVGEAVRKDRFRRNDDVDRLPKPPDLAAFGLEVSEELLLDCFARDAGFVIDVILGKDLVRRRDMDLHVLESEARVERAVEKAEELRDLLGPGQDRR